MHSICLTIVDDPANQRVFKGAGHWPAARGERVLRMLETALPGLLFDCVHDDTFTYVRGSAHYYGVLTARFEQILVESLSATGTQLMGAAASEAAA